MTDSPMLRWINLGQPESARALLTTVATSMISIATLTFSITIVTLTLASSTFGPRIIYNFMRDRSNQFALGVFVGTFVYCLLVLRAVRSGDATSFVPHVSVTVALAAGVLGIWVLVGFIHRVAKSLQADLVIAEVCRELQRLIASHFCDDGERQSESEARRSVETECGFSPVPQSLANSERPHLELETDREGVVQAIDIEELAEIATEHDGCFVLGCRIGHRWIDGLSVAPFVGASDLDDKTRKRALGAFVTGPRRTLVDDVEFGFQQLAEIAVRALSPGVNDPFTARSCVDEIGSALALILRRGEPRRVVRDDSGAIRVYREELSFSQVVAAAFRDIRQHASGELSVTTRMLEIIAKIARLADSAREIEALRVVADETYGVACGADRTESDRSDLEQRKEAALQRLEERTRRL